MRVDVVRLEPNCPAIVLLGFVELAPPLEYPAQVIMCRRMGCVGRKGLPKAATGQSL